MNEFNFYNPTKIIFGENAIENLAKEMKPYGNKILFAYGKESIKKNGIYDKVIEILNGENKKVFELSGIMPNPRKEKVYEGIKICKENNIDFILAVGGGSVIDCAKAIAVGAKTDKDFWNTFYINYEVATQAIPIATILTLSATGTEMDAGSVITDWETHIKTHYESKLISPKFSILDPTHTYTLPKEQTIYGSVDILAHVFEQYFSSPEESNLSDNLAEAVIKNVIENLETAINEPTNYIARSNLMWCSTMALNGIIGLGKSQDWNCHRIEHALSGIYDIAHGEGLAILFPAWMTHVYKYGIPRFKRYAINIWNVSTEGKTDEEIALEGIEKTKQYFRKIGAPLHLSEVNIPKEDIDKITDKAIIDIYGSYVKITKEDVKQILELAI